jgi:amino acid transporter
LTILAVLGTASLQWFGWVMAPIIVLLIVLFASYWQTIEAYPQNGGAYLVAKENLGMHASLLAAAALMIDYVLNVAVGISAGIGALVSAMPSLQSHILALCLCVLCLITLINLRGTRDSGRVLAIPAYLFVLCFAAIIVWGVVRSIVSHGHPHALVAPPAIGAASATASAWLLLRAFASGCTAMTGIEAVSNGMSTFREPRSRYGHRTLAGIVAILALFLAGIAYLAIAYHIGAMDQTRGGYQSVLSQLAGAIVGRGVFYYIAIASLLAVLALSANTSFVAFPRLCRAVAGDGFLPETFTISGRRLVFSVGVLYLAACAGVLLLVFGGITDRLIPLFAVGAFLSFTLSQAAMAVHWHRMPDNAARPRERFAQRARFWINAAGAAITGITLVIIVVAKFVEGAWITVLAIPCVIALLRWVRRYYDTLYVRVQRPEPIDLRTNAPPVVIIAVEAWNRLASRAIEFGLGMSSDVVGVHLTELEGPESIEHERVLRECWQRDVEEPARTAGLTPPKLRVLPAQYRRIHVPVLNFIDEIEAEFPTRRIAVLIPEIVKQHWYQRILHAHRGSRLRSCLLTHGGSRLTVISVPWRLDEPPATRT